MLDVPALALALFSIVVFLKACDRESVPYALFAGLVLGLATETKYTGATAGAAIFVYGLSSGKTRLAVLAGLAALVVFFGIEALIAHGYRETPFLAHFSHP